MNHGIRLNCEAILSGAMCSLYSKLLPQTTFAHQLLTPEEYNTEEITWLIVMCVYFISLFTH